MLPHIRGRPLTFIRHPDGISKFGFFQKSVSDYFPDWIHRVTVGKEGGTVTHPLADDAAALVYFANQAAITLHTWTSRVPNLEKPDIVVWDFDPATDDFRIVRTAARDAREILEAIGLVPFAQTTGSRGLHVVVPILPAMPFDSVRAFADEVGDMIVARRPHRYTREFRKNKRADRLFVDTARNAYAQTYAAPYTVRTKAGAPVATPIEWGELGPVKPQRWNVRNILRRMSRKGDAWKDIEASAGNLEAAWTKLRRRSP
jgi:bifunctional non-homologous end joining protein LigD